MRARRIVGLAMAIALISHSRLAIAWGPVGHKTVAMIAQSRLSPGTLQRIRDIMGAPVDLDWIANCPDVFAHSNGHFICAGIVMMAGDPEKTKPWHFIDIPITKPGSDGSQTLNTPDADSLASYCKSSDACVVNQIRKDLHVLQDPSTSLQAKQMALVFLVHFVGDAHQPLHCANDNDSGGTLKFVDVKSKDGGASPYLNLHQVWDHVINNPAEQDANSQAPESPYAQAKDLAAGLEQDLANPQSHPPAEIASWTNGDLPGKMALESFAIAQAVIYPDYAADQGHIADSQDPHEIGKDYQRRMQPIAYRRIEMAGVRLAALLEQAFGKQRSGFSSVLLADR